VFSGRLAVGVGVLTVAIAGCGSGDDGLSKSDIRAALERLPYRNDYKPVSYSGNGSVVAGLARFGPHATYFAVIGGHPRINGRVVPRQRLPNGGFQHGVDTASGSSGAPWTTEFVYTPTSIPRISEDIDTAICEAAGGKGCQGL
jgi:hypothetical protein